MTVSRDSCMCSVHLWTVLFACSICICVPLKRSNQTYVLSTKLRLCCLLQLCHEVRLITQS